MKKPASFPLKNLVLVPYLKLNYSRKRKQPVEKLPVSYKMNQRKYETHLCNYWQIKEGCYPEEGDN